MDPFRDEIREIYLIKLGELSRCTIHDNNYGESVFSFDSVSDLFIDRVPECQTETWDTRNSDSKRRCLGWVTQKNINVYETILWSVLNEYTDVIDLSVIKLLNLNYKRNIIN